jgi:hypothetical protein
MTKRSRRRAFLSQGERSARKNAETDCDGRASTPPGRRFHALSDWMTTVVAELVIGILGSIILDIAHGLR